MKNKNAGLVMLSLVVIGSMQPVYAAQRQTPAQQRAAAAAAAARADADAKAKAEAERKAEADRQTAAEAERQRAGDQAEAERKAAADKLAADIRTMLQATAAVYKTYLDTTFAALDSELAKFVARSGFTTSTASALKSQFVVETLDTAQKMTASGTDHLLKQDMFKDFKFFVEEWGAKP